VNFDLFHHLIERFRTSHGKFHAFEELVLADLNCWNIDYLRSANHHLLAAPRYWLNTTAVGHSQFSSPEFCDSSTGKYSYF